MTSPRASWARTLGITASIFWVGDALRSTYRSIGRAAARAFAMCPAVISHPSCVNAAPSEFRLMTSVFSRSHAECICTIRRVCHRITRSSPYRSTHSSISVSQYGGSAYSRTTSYRRISWSMAARTSARGTCPS